MKLLTPKEASRALADEEVRLKALVNETLAVAQKEEKRLNDLRGRFALAEVELRSLHEMKVSSYSDAEKELLNELEALDRRRLALLYSTDEKRMKEREHACLTREMTLNEKEVFYSNWKKELEAIERKLEKDVNKQHVAEEALRQQVLTIQEEERRTTELKEKATRLLGDAERRVDMVSLKEKDLTDAVISFEKRQMGEESALRSLEASLKKESGQIEQDRIALQDAYTSLARAREEILGRKT